MRAKWLDSILTPCPRYLRQMAYLDQMLGLERRYQRCRTAWAPHLEACKRLILETAGTCVKRDKAVILGSGFLYDVPLVELASLFDEVVLVDILHPPAYRLGCVDVSGGIRVRSLLLRGGGQ